MNGTTPGGQSITFRSHPAVLMNPLMLTLAGLIVVAVLNATSLPPILTLAAWAAWGALLLRLFWKAAEWAVSQITVTPERMSFSSGLLTRHMSMIPLTRVTNVSLRRSLLGQMLDYGELNFEVPRQGQAVRVVNYVPHPDQLYLELTSWMFPGKQK
jgi:uncharacterized membrane protein YdbT with pleckstrin-like domain